MGELWLPGLAGPHEDFVARVHREIERFARERELAKASVSVELADGARFRLERLSPEPGYGFITLRPVADDDAPDELIVPIATIRRIELSATPDEPERFGFSLPGQS